MQKNYPLSLEGYIIGEKIGSGTFSDVYHAVVISNKENVALKCIKLENDIELLSKETALMRMLHHQNIPIMYCSFVSKNYLWIVMSFEEGGSFSSILKKMYPNGIKDEKILATILKYVLEATKYIHINNMIHRDIKPGNILLSSEGEIKLCDLGISATILDESKNKRHSFIGTLNYMAPEIIDSDPGYNEKVDIWAIGITSLELAFGTSPYNKLTPIQVLKKIVTCDSPTCQSFQDYSYTFSSKFSDFVSKCLTKDSLNRPTAEELLNCKFIKQAENKIYIKKSIVDKMGLTHQIKELNKQINVKEEVMSNNEINEVELLE